MHVSEFIPKLSDCHCKISLKLLAHFEREYSNETGLTEFPSRYIWDKESMINFQMSFAHPAIQMKLKHF